MSKARTLASMNLSAMSALSAVHNELTGLAVNATVLNSAAVKKAWLPIGTLSYFPDGSVPDGWLAANGAAVSRTTYSELFAKVGTTYGVGNGTTTFNLPDSRGRTLIGAGQGAGLTNRALGATGGEEGVAITEAQMPLHGHPVRTSVASSGSADASTATTGGFPMRTVSVSNQAAFTGTPANTAGQQIGGTGGGQSHNNMQPFMSLNIYIYAGV